MDIDVVSLQESFSQLAEELETVSAELRRLGQPPSIKVAERIELVAEGFNSAWEAFSSPTDFGHDEPRTLENLIRLVEAHRQESEVSTLIDLLLDAAASLSGEPLEFILSVRDEARKLRELIAHEKGDRINAVRLELASRKHPIAALVLITFLDDLEWEQARQILDEKYGLRIATSAARGNFKVDPALGQQIQGLLSSSEQDDHHVQEREPEGNHEQVDSGIAEVAETLPDSERVQESELQHHEDQNSDSALDYSDRGGNETRQPIGELRDLESGAVVELRNLQGSERISAGQERIASNETPNNPVNASSNASDEVDSASLDPQLSVKSSTFEESAQSLQYSSPDTAVRTFYRLVSDDRLGLATWLADARGHEDGPNDLPPAWLLRASLLAKYLVGDDGRIAERFKFEIEQRHKSQLNEWGVEGGKTQGFLSLAATLRPTLIAPNTNAHLLLATGLNALSLPDEVKTYFGAINDFGFRRYRLDREALGQLVDQAQKDSQLDGLQRKAREWKDQAVTYNFKYTSAGEIWRALLSADGPIGIIASSIINNDVAAASEVRKHVQEIESDAKFRGTVDRFDSRKKKGSQVRYTAFEQLRRRSSEAARLGREWTDLVQIHEDLPEGSRKETEILRNTIGKRQDNVLAELEATEYQSIAQGKFLEASSIHLCRKAVEQVEELLRPEIDASARHEPTPEMVLSGELLRCTALPLDADTWAPCVPNPQLDAEVISISMTPEPSWPDALEKRLVIGDLAGAYDILDYLRGRDQQVDRNWIDTVSKRIDSRLREARETLRLDCEAVTAEIEKTLMLGLLEEGLRSQLSEQVESVKLGAPTLIRFEAARERLTNIRSDLSDRRAMAAKDARRRLDLVRERLTDRVTPDHINRIDLALQRDDLHTANEYIALIERGEELPVEVIYRSTLEDFISAHDQLRDYFIHGPNRSPSRSDRHSRRTITKPNIDLDINQHPLGYKENQMLYRAWEDLFRPRSRGTRDESTHVRDVRSVMESLGFIAVKAEAGKKLPNGSGAWYDVTYKPISDRDKCAVPFFGSASNGRLKVLVSHKCTDDLLLDELHSESRNTASLILKGVLAPLEWRIEFSQKLTQKKLSTLVLDETLVRFLDGRGVDQRLADFFHCTLPFAAVNPFVTTSGHIPPEMFYGRVEERASIESVDGTSFIYGGRQLGKTALLREVKRAFHNPTEERIAIWYDLKLEGITYHRGLEDLWRELGEELAKSIPTTKSISTLDDFCEEVGTWIAAGVGRRILLLLDEADRFVESDAKEEFYQIERLKGLMDKTGRSFKLVLAGLHNVQRTARQSNQPLAHLGMPVRIGPLIDNSEWIAARELIEKPLAAIGFRASRDHGADPVAKILSRTNYYPSLIQLYCHELVRHLTEPKLAGNKRREIPGKFTDEHVDKVFAVPQLRDAIISRFNWTLDLDQRYRVIALVIALETIDDHTSGAGLSADAIWKEATYWWSEGYNSSTSHTIFLELLEEMIGLGVLAKTDAGMFSLRSPNVLSLIGPRDHVEAELQTAGERDPEPPYSPMSFRSYYRDKKGANHKKRHPLTIAEEGQVLHSSNGCVIVAGAEASGMGQLIEFLSASKVIELKVFQGDTKAQFDDWLKHFTPNAKHNGVSLGIIPAAIRWDDLWVDAASKRTSSFNHPRSFGRLVFLADPNQLWHLVARQSDSWYRFKAEDNDKLRLISLRPWDDYALAQWIDGCNLGSPNVQLLSSFRSASGNWPALISGLRLLEGKDSTNPQAALDNLANSLDNRGTAESLLPSFGLDQEEPTTILRGIREWNDTYSLEEMVEILDGTHLEESIRAAHEWAVQLALVSLAGRDQWRIDPIVSKLLQVTE